MGKTTVEAFDKVRVEAKGRSMVYAHDEAAIIAGDSSSVRVFGYPAVTSAPGVSIARYPATRILLPNEMNTAENFEKNYIALASTGEFRHNPFHAGRMLIRNAGHGNREKILLMLHKKGRRNSREIKDYLLKLSAEHRKPERNKRLDDYDIER
jgi:hypothetical protein